MQLFCSDCRNMPDTGRKQTELLQALNHRQQRVQPGSRHQLYMQVDKSVTFFTELPIILILWVW